VETERGLLCATCAQRLDEEAAPEPKPAQPEAVQARPDPELTQTAPARTEDAARLGEDLRGIRQKLDLIHRAVMFEKSSTWNVVGAVAQCLAAGMLLAAAFRWLEDPLNLLLVALMFQVMALTFFVKAK